jgi:phage pi2 protein 07
MSKQSGRIIEEKKSQKKEISKSELEKWISEIYQDISLEVLQSWYDEIKYKGFDRASVIKDLKDKLIDNTLIQKFILVCTLRGPVAASQVSINGRRLIAYGIPLRGIKGQPGASINRVSAALADYAAYMLKKLNVPKKLQMECPGWLQFPAAASIDMPETYRRMHREFTEEFSKRIDLSKDGSNGFKPEIYEQMQLNCYYDKSLKLFD